MNNNKQISPATGIIFERGDAVSLCDTDTCPTAGNFVMENSKVCFKCGERKPLSEYYKHKQMGDGHLNKCKACTKKDVKERYFDLAEDESFYEKERARGREKYKRLEYKDKYKYTPVSKTIHAKLKRKGLIESGYEAHHWNNSEIGNVIILDRKSHSRLHQLLNKTDEGLFETKDGELLDTAEKHIAFIVKSGFEYKHVVL